MGWKSWFQFFSISGILLCSIFCFAVGNQAKVPLDDLVSHLLLLLESPKNSQTNFELGLTYQLLADAAEEDLAFIGDALSHKNIVAFEKGKLKQKSEESYRLCLDEDANNVEALSNLALLLSHPTLQNNQLSTILELHEKALTADPFHLQSNINYGVMLRDIGRHNDAVNIFQQALSLHPESLFLQFELAFSLELIGNDDIAANLYTDIIEKDPRNVKALLNLGAIHHKHFAFDAALSMYTQAHLVMDYDSDCFKRLSRSMFSSDAKSPFSSLDLKMSQSCDCPSDVDTTFKILLNIGQALYQLGNYAEANDWFEENLALLIKCSKDGVKSKEYLTTAVMLFLSSKASCFFPSWDWLDSLINSVDDLGGKGPTAIKPFDALGLPVTAQWKKNVAKKFSDELTNQGQTLHSDAQPENNRGKKLRLGFISHDFGDHPTTYLVEGVFTSQRNDSAVDFAAYSYGPDNESRARKNIVRKLGDSNFIDIYGLSHDDAVERICKDGVNILFDMQGFTLGNRYQILASKCARPKIQVNFLAFPGTSGSQYIDYVIVDSHVAAIERAKDEFTEKLAVLPRSYQANYFKDDDYILVRGSAEWKELRAKENLSTSTSVFVFSNLNKQDKIDPYSFGAWLECLAQVPMSVLWLLEPSQAAATATVKQNIFLFAEKKGISRDRIVFAKRVERSQHLRRMAAGDLFLDTFLYGAHTTATDSLRGGMPLLTLAGESFSNRVGMSLLQNMNSHKASSLTTFSLEEFIQVAVEIARLTNEFEFSLGAKFIKSDSLNGHELFNYQGYSNDLNSLSKMMWELKALEPTREMHVMLSSSSKIIA